MADARVIVGVRRSLALLLLLAGCDPTGAAPPVTAATARAPATAFSDDPRPLPRYLSKRLGVSLPLPDGTSWRIDDHSRPELVATHAPTRSRIVVAVIRTDEVVGRVQCEELAGARKLVATDGLRTLEDEAAVTLETFDTRVLVALEAGPRLEKGGNVPSERPLVGHVMAFGGFLRKCYVFDFVTEVDDEAQEPVLSARLAFARARILGGLELRSFASVPRLR